jgi:hypothetical protein
MQGRIAVESPASAVPTASRFKAGAPASSAAVALREPQSLGQQKDYIRNLQDCVNRKPIDHPCR